MATNCYFTSYCMQMILELIFEYKYHLFPVHVNIKIFQKIFHVMFSSPLIIVNNLAIIVLFFGTVIHFQGFLDKLRLACPWRHILINVIIKANDGDISAVCTSIDVFRQLEKKNCQKIYDLSILLQSLSNVRNFYHKFYKLLNVSFERSYFNFILLINLDSK